MTTESNDDLLLKPTAPNPSDCCGTGCSPCVYDIYEADLKTWKRDCQNIKANQSKSEQRNTFDSSIFKDFEIIDKFHCASDSFIFRIKVPEEECLNILIGQHVIIREKYSDKYVMRQYTPMWDLENDTFTLLVKVYPKGKMTPLLSKKEVGQSLSMRGPYGSFYYKENTYKTLLMLAAGTGIAPIYQIIRNIMDNENDFTVIYLLYSSKSQSDILLKKELNELESYWNFHIDYYLSNETMNCTDKYKNNVLNCRLNKADVKAKLNKFCSSIDTYVLICGTKSFTKDMINAALDANVLEKNIFKF